MIARTTSVWKACASIVCLLTLLLASFSCGGTNEVETGTVVGVEQEVRPPPRCAPASSIQMEYVRSGIKGVQVSNNVRQGMAVKSNEFEKAYFVSAKIYGPGIEDGEGPGVWFITGDKTSPGMIFSVNSYAKLYSDFPDVSTMEWNVIMDDEAIEARNCAE